MRDHCVFQKAHPVFISGMESARKNLVTMVEPERPSVPSQAFVGKLKNSMIPQDLQKKGVCPSGQVQR